jgi:hypothetical protein
LFVLIWCLSPILLFSMLKTTLAWYIAPAIPAMAMLVALPLTAAARSATRAAACWWREGYLPGLKASMLLLYVAVGYSVLLFNLSTVWREVSLPKERLAIDKTVANMVLASRSRREPMRVVFYGSPHFADDERPYANMIRPNARIIEKQDEMVQLLEQGQIDFVVTRANIVDQIVSARPVLRYKVLVPRRNRKQWLAVLSYVEQEELNAFTPVKRGIRFGEYPAERILYGLSEPRMVGSMPTRAVQSSIASLLVSGDILTRKFGAEVVFNGVANLPPGEQLIVLVKLNGITLVELSPAANTWETHNFRVMPGIWQAGENALSFELKLASGRKIEHGENILLLNWMRMELWSGL